MYLLKKLISSMSAESDLVALCKAALANHPGYVLRDVVDHNGHRTRRWFRSGSAEATRLGHASAGGFSPEEAMIDAMRQVGVPYFPNTSDSNRMTARRAGNLREMALRGDIDGIANFSTSRTRANYAAVDDYKVALLAAANAARHIAPPDQTLPAAPAPTAITAANMQNSALLSAQRKIDRLAEAAASDDPIPAILAIETTRSNGYTRAADDYRTLLLRHFGCNSDGTPLPDSQRGENVSPQPVAPQVSPAPRPARRAPRPRRPVPPPTPTNPVPGSANPLNMTEAQLGFVPRPNYPLDYYTGRDGYWTSRSQNGPATPYPTTEQRDLARRYLNQSTDLQTRAREYQAGTWVPDTPEARARREAQARQERERNEAAAREANERNRQATAALQTKLLNSGFAARGIPGINIHEWAGINWATMGTNVKHVLGINSPEELKHAIGTMFADYGGNAKFKITVGATNSLVSVDARGTDGTVITRYFNKHADGKLVVDHSYFQAGSSGGNSGKAFLRASMGVYKALGASRVDVHANIDVGGYTWARFGFKPTTTGRLLSIKNEIKNNLLHLAGSDWTRTTAGRTTAYKRFTPEQVAQVETLLASSNPELVWAVADLKVTGNDLGKALLLGTNWYGSLDMTDNRTMRRFARYVN